MTNARTLFNSWLLKPSDIARLTGFNQYFATKEEKTKIENGQNGWQAKSLANSLGPVSRPDQRQTCRKLWSVPENTPGQAGADCGVQGGGEALTHRTHQYLILMGTTYRITSLPDLSEVGGLAAIFFPAAVAHAVVLLRCQNSCRIRLTGARGAAFETNCSRHIVAMRFQYGPMYVSFTRPARRTINSVASPQGSPFIPEVRNCSCFREQVRSTRIEHLYFKLKFFTIPSRSIYLKER